jgi:hypothetical protein
MFEASACLHCMARTRGKREGPKDLTKQARIDAAVRDTLAGVFHSFQSAGIAHKVRTCTTLTSLQFNLLQVPPQTVRDRAAGKATSTRHSLINEAQEKFWWTGATITRIQQPLSIYEHSVVECLRWLVLTLVKTGSAASFPVTQTSLS